MHKLNEYLKANWNKRLLSCLTEVASLLSMGMVFHSLGAEFKKAPIFFYYFSTSNKSTAEDQTDHELNTKQDRIYSVGQSSATKNFKFNQKYFKVRS